MSIPSNLVPTSILQLPEDPSPSNLGWMMYVNNGVTYRVQVNAVLNVTGVPSTRAILTGAGLTGGGDLSVNRTISVAVGGIGYSELAVSGVTPGTYGSSSELPIITVDQTGRVTAATTTAFSVAGYVPVTRQVIAGTGLTGGGALNADVTLNAVFSNALPLALGAAASGSANVGAREGHIHPAVNLASIVETSGILGMVSGGTGVAHTSPAAGSIAYSDGSGIQLSTVGVLGQVLSSTGATAPTWADVEVVVAVPANTVRAGPTSGADATPTYRALVNNDLPSTGVAANTYGTQVTVPVFAVNAKGVISSVTNTAIGNLPNSALTNSAITIGSTSVALGGTLTTLAGTSISGATNTLSNIGNASLTNSTVTINGNSVSLGGSTTVTATATNALTIGTGLSGTSYNGSTAVTVAIANTGVTAASVGSASKTLTATVNAQGQLTALADTAIAISNTQVSGLGSAALLTAGAAGGVATLDGGGTVPTSQLPAAVLGALKYQGTWNATTNVPTLTSSVGTQGYYYVVSVAGATNLDGITDWKIGDWAIFGTATWQKIDNTDAVASVNGFTGTVVLGASDVGAQPVFTSQTANYVYAAPNGSAGVPTFRALVAADIPALSGSYVPYTGASSAIDLNAKTLVNVANLGVNTTTVPTIRFRAYGDNNSTSRIAMRGYSSDANSSSIRVSKFRGTVASPQAPLSGDSLGKFELAGYGTTSADAYAQVSLEGVTTEIWSATARGAKALIKVTPNTTITQVTAVTVDQDLSVAMAGALSVTGHTTFEGVTSTGATGTGKLVYDTSPSFTTPALGTPSSGTVTNLTGTASININGTVGATTPAAVTGTNLMSSGGIWAKSLYAGTTYTDGLVIDYVSPTARFSAGTSDGFAWYNAGVGTTSLMTLSSAGVLAVTGGISGGTF